MFTLCSLSHFVKHMDGVCQVCFHCVSTAWHGKKCLRCKFRASYWILYLGIRLVSLLRSSTLFLDLLLVFPHSSLVPRGQSSQERSMFALLALLEVSEETISSPLVVVLTNLVWKMAGALWSFFHWKAGAAVHVMVIPLPQLQGMNGCSAPIGLCFVCLHLKNSRKQTRLPVQKP